MNLYKICPSCFFKSIEDFKTLYVEYKFPVGISGWDQQPSSAPSMFSYEFEVINGDQSIEVKNFPVKHHLINEETSTTRTVALGTICKLPSANRMKLFIEHV